jgi:radical SAM protein with 4Fe4S-binding SPASM domain
MAERQLVQRRVVERRMAETEKKEASVLDELHHAAARSESLLSLQLIPTGRCNLYCRHCYRAPEQVEPSTEFSTEQICALMREARQLGCIWVSFNGGEFLLRRDWETLVKEARRLKFVVSILSNGTLIDESVAKTLAKLRLCRVFVSLYGSDAKTHEFVTRVPGSYKRTIDGLKNLEKYEVPRYVSIIVMRNNAEQVPEIVRFAENIGARSQIDIMLTKGLKGNKGVDASIRVEDAQVLKLLIVPEIEEKIASKTPVCPDREKCDETLLCGAGVSTISIDPRGQVWPCSSLPLDCGNIHERTLTDLFKNGSAGLDLIRKSRISDLKKCACCELKEWCGRCPGQAYMDSGSIFGCAPENRRLAKTRRKAFLERQKKNRCAQI